MLVQNTQPQDKNMFLKLFLKIYDKQNKLDLDLVW